MKETRCVRAAAVINIHTRIQDPPGSTKKGPVSMYPRTVVLLFLPVSFGNPITLLYGSLDPESNIVKVAGIVVHVS